MKGGEWLARQFEDYIDFLKWTQEWIWIISLPMHEG